MHCPKSSTRIFLFLAIFLSLFADIAFASLMLGDVCLDISFEGDNTLAYLHATCLTNDGPGLRCSTLDLNGCLGNDDGQLNDWESGGFYGSCDSCDVDGTVLSCECLDHKKVMVETSFDLNTTVAVGLDTGLMSCFKWESSGKSCE